jgi:hypothetical protein
MDDKACSQKIQELEGQSKRHDISQIFMETPYRNTSHDHAHSFAM